MKHPFIKTISNIFLSLLLISALISCGEDGLEPLDDCEQGMKSYLTELERVPDEIDIVECPSRLINSIADNDDIHYSAITFSPHDDHKILLHKVFAESETYSELVIFDFCSGEETILHADDNWFFGRAQWTKSDWIYFVKYNFNNFFKIKANGDSLQAIERPGEIYNLKWNDQGDKLAYLKDLPSGRLIIIADEKINPTDTIQGFDPTIVFDFAADNKFVFGKQDENATRGLYEYDFKTKSAVSLSSYDRDDRILNIDASEHNSEIYWSTQKGIFKTNASTGITEKIIESSFLNFHDGLSKSEYSNYLLTTRIATSLDSGCKYITQSNSAVVDLNTNTIKKIAFDK